MIVLRTVCHEGRAKTHGEAHLKLVTPAIEKRTVTPNRPPNSDLRTREYLTETEMERLMAAARSNRYGHRDATMALVAYTHGLRACEPVGPVLFKSLRSIAFALAPPHRPPRHLNESVRRRTRPVFA